MNVKTDTNIGNVLKDLGIYPSVKGYYYLIDLVHMVQDGELMIGYMTKIGYPRLGRKYGCTSESAERSCRTAICTSYRRNSATYGELLHLNRRPTIADFVFTLADYLELEE